MAKSLRRSVAALPPTHFLTLRPNSSRTTDKAFTGAITKFLKALKRRSPGKRLEYLVVNEWRNGVRHAHALVRLDATMSLRSVRRSVRAARGVVELCCSAKPVRNVTGAANYIFKHTRRPEKKAELTPATFRGRIYAVSKRFLTKPFKTLWREISDARPKGIVPPP
jgi:hypothetical protein